MLLNIDALIHPLYYIETLSPLFFYLFYILDNKSRKTKKTKICISHVKVYQICT
jgi:hypothetical protein